MPDPILKTAAAEIEAVLKKHDIAGIVLLSSTTHTEYLLHVDPSWSPCFVQETLEGRAIRFRALRADYPSKEAHEAAVKNGVSLLMGFIDTGKDVTAMLETVAAMLAKKVEFTHWTQHEREGGEPHA